MYTETYQLWDITPGLCEEIPSITYYQPEHKRSERSCMFSRTGGTAWG